MLVASSFALTAGVALGAVAKPLLISSVAISTPSLLVSFKAGGEQAESTTTACNGTPEVTSFSS